MSVKQLMKFELILHIFKTPRFLVRNGTIYEILETIKIIL